MKLSTRGRYAVMAMADLARHTGHGKADQPVPLAAMGLIMRRRILAGSLIGGIAETQEMLDFCAEHNITCDVEVIRAQQINEAYERLLKSDVKYRFVIDIASLK